MTVHPPARDAWLAWRRQGIGASDVAAILGISPWASPWSVWADKLGLLPEQPEDDYMRAGRWLERAIGPWFEDQTNLTVAGEQTWCTHREHKHHRCTVDGFTFDGAHHLCVDCGHLWDTHRTPSGCTMHGCHCTEWNDRDVVDPLGALEIKVTGPGRRWDLIPEHYQAQGQWQMHVCGLERVWFAALMGRRLDIHELARDQADIDFMVKRVDAFWHDHVLTGQPPDVDGSDATARALAAVFPRHTPGAAVPVQWGHVESWVAAKSDEKAAKANVDFWANAIRAELGDAEEGTVDGQRVVSWRAQTRTTTCRHCGASDTGEPFRVLRHHPPKEKQ